MSDWTSPDQTVRLLTGHVLERLRDVPDESVHCVVTSPPYWSQRDYGVENQIGSEPTIAEYVATITAVFAEIRRVLHRTGICFLNLGDKYNSYDANRGNSTGVQKHNHAPLVKRAAGYGVTCKDLKPKDLCGLPWRVAFALQDDGWYLRSDILWIKDNCMPGSQLDRPTCQHEYVFLLAKSERYFFDMESVRSPIGDWYGKDKRYREGGKGRNRQGERWMTTAPVDGSHRGFRSTDYRSGAAIRTAWRINPQPFRGAMCRACRTVYLDGTQRFPRRDGDKAKPICPTCGTWDQWLSHFAVMPERLAERCILAGTSERGVCPQCGEPWRRVVERDGEIPQTERREGLRRRREAATGVPNGTSTLGAGIGGDVPRQTIKTTGWQPACQCVEGPFPDFIGDHQHTVGTCSYPEPVPAVVLDPFAGTGTTLAVARRLGRHALGIELNPDYAEICRARVMAPPRRLKVRPAIIPDARQQTLF